MKKIVAPLCLLAAIAAQSQALADLYCDKEDPSFTLEMTESGFTWFQGDDSAECEIVENRAHCVANSGLKGVVANPIIKTLDNGSFWYATSSDAHMPRLMERCD